MKTMPAKYQGACCECGASVLAGEQMGYNGAVHCMGCVERWRTARAKPAADRAARQARIDAGELVQIRWRRHPSHPRPCDARTVRPDRVLDEVARLEREMRPLVIEVGGWRWVAPGLSSKCLSALGLKAAA
jgi:hypothetical protein